MVIMTTKTRIYQFVGSLSNKRNDEGGMLDAIMQPYISGEAQPSTLTFSIYHPILSTGLIYISIK